MGGEGLLSHFKSPLVLILVFAAIISAIAGERPNALIVLVVVFGSTTLRIVHEYRASDGIEKMRFKVMIKSTALRDGQSCNSKVASTATTAKSEHIGHGANIKDIRLSAYLNWEVTGKPICDGTTFCLEAKQGAHNPVDATAY